MYRDRSVSPLTPPDPGDRVAGLASTPPIFPIHAAHLVDSPHMLSRAPFRVNGSLDSEVTMASLSTRGERDRPSVVGGLPRS
jgi:hypothetical protein